MIEVNVDNFVRAETDRMFGDLLALAGGVNRWSHARRPTAIDAQTVIRMNRDTLYSFAVADIRDGATVTLPEAGDRYMSVAVVDQDHHVNQILHAPGEHRITVDVNRTPFVGVLARILVNPEDPDDVAEVNRLQDRLGLVAASAQDYVRGDYDADSLRSTRRPLLKLAAGIPGFDRTFGGPAEVDPVRHLIGTAAGWGGLPVTEAYYLNVDPGLPVGEYEIRVGEVPVDAFWSVSMYNADGFFEKNGDDAYSVNDVTAVRDHDGAITIRLAPQRDGAANFLPIGDGWNYIVRLYRPRPEVLDGTWSFPEPQSR